jgi:hypothetical protein
MCIGTWLEMLVLKLACNILILDEDKVSIKVVELKEIFNFVVV